MIKLNELISYLDDYLKINDINDNHYNGLQVEGKSNINKIIFAVDAGLLTFEKAIKANADMIIVHHGHFFKSITPMISGWKKQRLEILLKNNISLYAVHLPLDAHPEVGNNAQLFDMLGAQRILPFDFIGNKNVSWIGSFAQSKTLQEIVEILNSKLSTTCKILPFGSDKINTIAISSGGAGYKVFSQALNSGVDLYITGDAIEIYQTARDAKINVIFAGHYATETLGVKALAKHIENKFMINTEFIDLPTGL